jgi:hypothetical protein
MNYAPERRTGGRGAYLGSRLYQAKDVRPVREGRGLEMTANKTWLAGRTGMSVAFGVLVAAGCGSDSHKGHHDEKDAGHMEPDAGGGDGDGDTPTKDASTGDGDTDGSVAPQQCGVGDHVCPAATPACVNGECVECSADDTSACATSETCDVETHGCVDKYAPFALDCAHLPTDGDCTGGPHEVILAAHETGFIAMFDAKTAEYLGYLKRDNVDFGDDQYMYATQGPDQCIWMVSEGDARGIERWDTDGTFKDTVIPTGKHWAPDNANEDLINDPRQIAFTPDSVLVASDGTPPRVSRFGLDGSFKEVVLDDGSDVASMIASHDGSLIIANKQTDAVEVIPAAGGKKQQVLASVTPAQLWYEGDGKILTSDNTGGGSIFEVEIDSGKAKEAIPAPPVSNPRGVAWLGKSEWLMSSANGIEKILPDSMVRKGEHSVVFNEPSASDWINFNSFGRACLSDDFIKSRAHKAAETTCPGAPDGSSIFEQNFETGDLASMGFTEAAGDTKGTASIDTTGHSVDSTHSLKIVGGTDFRSGVSHDIAAAKPKYVSYWVKVSQTEYKWFGYFVLTNTTNNASIAGTLVDWDTVTAFNSSAASTLTAEQWVQVEMRNIDWNTRLYDLYVDCKRVAEGITLGRDAGDTVDRLDLFNWQQKDADTDPDYTAWFDDIVIK